MALLTAENIVKDVEARKVKAGTPDERTVYDIVDKDDVKWTAWERQTAEAAFALKGQPSVWKVAIDQNGKYTNRTLKEIAARPTGGFAPAISAMDAQIGSGPSMSPGVFPTAPPAGAVEEPSFKDRTIWRQTATKVAAHLSKTQGEFWDNVDMLLNFYETGVRPYTAADVAKQLAQPDALPEAPQPDDDIPF